MKDQTITLQFDGGSRGNPGPAAYAYVIKRPGDVDEDEAPVIGGNAQTPVDLIRGVTTSNLKITDRNRFTGFRWLPVDSPLKRRLLQLSSVKFLLSLQPYGQQSGRAQEIVRQNEGRLLPGKENLIEVRTFTISGETKAVLFEHPPYERLPFSFSVAMQPAVYDGSMPLCGDGVEFRLEIRDSTGRIRPLYSRYIDPKHSLAERRWIPGSVDLSEYLGQTVELLFTTTAGPKGDTCAAWAGWGDPHFNGDITAQPAFRQVYDHEIKIYETPDYLPRAALFSSAELALDDAAALTRLGSSGLDIFQTAVVSATDLEPADLAAIASLNSLPRRQNCFLRLAGGGDRCHRGAAGIAGAERQRLSRLEGIRGRAAGTRNYGELSVSRRAA